MALPQFKRPLFSGVDVPSIVRQLNDLVGALGVFLDRLQRNFRLDSLVLTGISLVTLSNNVINHKLGRVPQGYSINRVTTSTTIYWVGWTATTITLFSSANATIDLEVW